MIMKYWGFLLLKLVAGAVAMRFVWAAILLGFQGPVLYLGLEQKPFGHDLGFTSAMLLFFLACFGVVYLIVWDQRYRCRTCLRRLRDARERGVVAKHAAVRTAAHRIHLPLRPRHSQSAGVPRC